ncbi:MAG TPA: HDOD domain-containing protein [Candidatus Acidoferrales bacterium]|nr:HDOD domain-containing protein [Candidatus Acidoferrales bacterium]
MQSQTPPILETVQENREARRRRLAKIITECVAGLPGNTSQLDALLSTPPVDLTRVTRIINGDSEFSGLLLSLASTELFNVRSCGVTLPQAVVLFGSDRLRTLSLACAFFKYASPGLSSTDRQQLWQHSFLSAALSERTARQVGYPESGQAYLAGLVHDIGRLPLLEAARLEKSASRPLPADWADSPSAERDCFGVDHCEIGKSIAAAWRLAPSFLDAVAYHHSPDRAKHDPDLAEIVAAGDHYANLLSPFAREDFAFGSSQNAGAIDALLQMCVPNLGEQGAADMLDSPQDEEFDEDLMAQLLN